MRTLNQCFKFVPIQMETLVLWNGCLQNRQVTRWHGSQTSQLSTFCIHGFHLF